MFGLRTCARMHSYISIFKGILWIFFMSLRFSLSFTPLIIYVIDIFFINYFYFIDFDRKHNENQDGNIKNINLKKKID